MDTVIDTQDVAVTFAPPSEGARSVLADLSAKLIATDQQELAIKTRHAEELAPILARHAEEIAPIVAVRTLTQTTIDGLRQLYPQQDKIIGAEPSAAGTPTEEVEEPVSGLEQVKQEPILANTSGISDSDQKPKGRFTLRYAIISVIRNANEFLSTKETVDLILSTFPDSKFERDNVLVGIRDARRSKGIVGIPVFALGSLTYLLGLKEFLNDPENPETVKEDYFEKTFQKVSSLGYTFSKETAGKLNSKSENQGYAEGESPKKKLAPVTAGASAESDTGVGGKPSQPDAAEKLNGHSLGQLSLSNSH